MREDLGNLYRHFAGMRPLPRLAVYAQFHREVVGIGDVVGGNNPRAQWAKCVNTLAEAEYAGFHLAALNIACGDVIEDHVAAHVVASLFG